MYILRGRTNEYAEETYYFNNWRWRRSTAQNQLTHTFTQGVCIPLFLLISGQAVLQPSLQIFPQAKHACNITLKGDRNNNKMERMNGEIRDREKTMRGLKINETPILQGYQLYHNYVRPHMALDGKTPSEVCGITVEGKNKWLTLIQNASQKRD